MSNFSVPASELTTKKDRHRFAVFVIETHAIADRAGILSHRKAHLTYLNNLENSGYLLGAGPTLSEKGDRYCGHGLLLLRAESFDHATAIAAEDPYHQHKLRCYRVIPWLLSEGWMHEAFLAESN